MPYRIPLPRWYVRNRLTSNVFLKPYHSRTYPFGRGPRGGRGRVSGMCLALGSRSLPYCRPFLTASPGAQPTQARLGGAHAQVLPPRLHAPLRQRWMQPWQPPWPRPPPLQRRQCLADLLGVYCQVWLLPQPSEQRLDAEALGSGHTRRPRTASSSVWDIAP